MLVQVDWPLPYWPGVVVFHAIYAAFEVKRFDNFQKYGEVGASTNCTDSLTATVHCMAVSLEQQLYT